MNFFFRSNTWQEFLLLLHSGAGIFFPINTSVSFRPVDSGLRQSNINSIMHGSSLNHEQCYYRFIFIYDFLKL